jgi:DnaJ-domain-containing protein 1
MALDHDSGEMQGTVREGRFAGRALAELELEELLALLGECRAQDTQSAAVLEAYLDRHHGNAWRERNGVARQAGGGMTVKEACEILGVDESADANEIISAHRRLMQKIHPDRGGSHYLATKINQAKDLLLGEA